MNNVLRIAGLTVHIKSDESINMKRLLPFLSYDDENPDLTLTIKGCDGIPHPEGRIILNEDIKWLLKKDSKDEICVYAVDEVNCIYYMLETNNLWSTGSISYNLSNKTSESAATIPLSEILFRNRILFYKGIVIHSSAIVWQKKGIMFSAPSETGKSTQAKLWEKYMNATILNEDRSAVRIINGRPVVYGTPWDGSSEEYLNAEAPLSVIVLLEQASQNTVHELQFEESLLKLMARTFLPYHNRDLMDIALRNLENIIREVPVYLLKCTPDKRAVEALWQLIK